MALKTIIIDSGFLFVLFNSKHEKHHAVAQIIQTQIGHFVIPYVVLTEAAFLFRRAGGISAVSKFLSDLTQSSIDFEATTHEDLSRAREIMLAYPTARLDFVDCCIMALSERLNVTEICTLDQRDFQIFRPKHCDYLTLLP